MKPRFSLTLFDFQGQTLIPDSYSTLITPVSLGGVRCDTDVSKQCNPGLCGSLPEVKV